MRRLWLLIVLLVCGVPLAYVAWQAMVTLRVLNEVERERDSWQRPNEVLAALNLSAGNTVVDFGSGAGYFALKLAPIVSATGSVLASDLRLESLAFLWVRARLRGFRTLLVLHADEDDPHLPEGMVDAVLIANTYHELLEPQSAIARLRARLKTGGRLVILDRAPRDGRDTRRGGMTTAHELPRAVVERDIRNAGFVILGRDDRFIDRASDDDVWWLLVAIKP